MPETKSVIETLSDTMLVKQIKLSNTLVRAAEVNAKAAESFRKTVFCVCITVVSLAFIGALTFLAWNFEYEVTEEGYTIEQSADEYGNNNMENITIGGNE